MSPLRFGTLSFAVILACVATTAWAENEGLDDLDQATDLQLKVQSAQDLEKVVELSESALKKGLDAENTKFAQQLIVSSLWQRASQLSQAIFDQPRPHPQWRQVRELILADLNKLLALDKSFVEAHVMLGKLHALPGGNRERALEAMDDALKLYQEAKDKKEVVATLLLRARMRENADERLADIQEAVKADPTSVEALQLRAAVHIERGEMEKALADFQELLQQDPNNVAVHQALANTYAGMKKYDEAIEHLNKAIELAPDVTLNFTLRAEIYEAQEKYDQALADLDHALKLQPNDPLALLARSQLYYMRENLPAARADVKRLLQMNPGFVRGILLRSMIAAAEGNFTEATKDLQDILKADPGNVELRLQLAAFYVADQRPRKAIELLTQVIEQDKDNWRALRARGDALLSVGKHAEAVADYNAGLAIEAEDDGILNNLAWVLATSPMDDVRNGTRSIELATKACEVTEYKKPHILSTLAAAYAESGNFEKAIEWSNKAVELGEEELKDQIEQLKDELQHYKDGKPFRELQNVEEKPDPPARVLET